MKLEDQLLYASLVCGIAPGGDPAHRLQLYFCAIEEPYSKSHIDDFQRVLETGVDSKGCGRIIPIKEVEDISLQNGDIRVL